MVLDHEPACCNYVPPRQPASLIMWLMLSVLLQTAFNLTEDEVISAITVGVDFGVAQVCSWLAEQLVSCLDDPDAPCLHLRVPASLRI